TSGGGEWIGMNGICPAVSVEIDTYQNGSRGDPAADHVGVNVYTPGGGGTCNGVPNHAGAGPVQADVSANIEDGTEHELRVTWDVSTTTMTTYFNGTQRLTYVNDIRNNVFGGNAMVYFGFTASTGGSFNLQYIIPNSASMDATKTSSPDTFMLADPSKQTTYTIDIVNDGIVTAFGTQISDTLPTGFTYVPGSTTGATIIDPVIDNSDPDHQLISWNLSATPIPPNGGTTTISFDAAIAPSVGVGLHRNDFVISGDNFVTINRSQTAAITIGPVDLSIDKSHTGTYSSGSNETFDLDVSNAGPDEALNIVVTDTLPAGLTYVSSTGTGWAADASAAPVITWSHPGPVASGASLPTISVTVLVDDAAAPAVTNTASVSSDSPDTDAGNDSDSDLIDVYDADLAIDKAHTGDFTVGVDDTFTLDVTSAGPDSASAIVVSDTLPAGLTYVSSTGTGWTADASGAPTITWAHPGPLASGGALPTITVTVAVDAAGLPSADNSASVSSALPDANPADDSDTDNIVIVPALADLTIQKLHIGSFTQNVDGDYEIAVGNLGPLPASDIEVTDTLPNGLTYVTSSGTGWTVDASGAPTIVWTHPGPLPAGGSLPTITLTVNPGVAAIPSVTNTASVTSTTTGENNPADNSDSDLTTVLAATSGNKPLYVRGNPGRELSRDPTVGTTTEVAIRGRGNSEEWFLTPTLAQDLDLVAGDHDITLWISRNNRGNSRTVVVDLEYQPSVGPRVWLGSGTITRTIGSGPGNTTDFVFTINTGATTIPAGSQIVMRVTNDTGGNANRRIFVHPEYGGAYSMVDLNAATVLAIDSMASYDAAYAGGSTTTQVGTGRAIWIRASVSDPFGRDDISGVVFDIFDANGL
ncbi:MAG: DUF11 domain-containing protein, partial [Deltaproteobacteria bacterium]|nr:DUF11 domain-containing protein [Deltaproteobacteria bacterium]